MSRSPHDRLAAKPRSGSSPGSQHLYGPETLDQVAEQSRADPAHCSPRSGGLSAEIVGKPVLTEAAAIRRVMLEANADPDCIGVIAWMHTFSPAKMWITGLDALRKPLLHLHTQLNEALPWASIDMDFMNLNQAAHGDREFGYVQTRLGVRPQDRRRARQRPDAGRAASTAGSGPRAGRDHLDGLRLARFGDNMRDVAVTEGDKVEAELRFGVSVNTYGVNDLVGAVDAVADAEVDALVAEYADTYRLAPELARGGERHESLRYAARIEAGLREFLTRRAVRRLHHQLPGPRRPAPAARAGRAAADGRRLRLRRRGRLEDLGAAGRRQGDGRRGRRGAPRSWRTTPTTSARASRRSSARTCWRSARPSRRTAPRARSTRWASATGRTRSGWSSTPPPARPP